MKFAFCVFKYFPFGGMQKNLVRIAGRCLEHGHKVEIFTMHWEGAVLDNIKVNIIPIKRLTNHAKYNAFSSAIQPLIQQGDFDAVIGFNKMHGLDFYYAPDPCFKKMAREKHGRLYRLTPRYRRLSELEKAVFDPSSKTRIFLLSNTEQCYFTENYNTPEDRFYLLPPGIDKIYASQKDSAGIRKNFRQGYGLNNNDKVVLMVGSGFKTKGLDRALKAVSSLPYDLRKMTRLFIVGKDNKKPFIKLAKKLGIIERVYFAGGRDDVRRFYLGSDILIHPAYSENTGTVILEAMISGLPVLTTDVCGYAMHVSKADAGIVLPSPFSQEKLHKTLCNMLTSNDHAKWSENGLKYGKTEDLYSRINNAVKEIERITFEKIGGNIDIHT